MHVDLDTQIAAEMYELRTATGFRHPYIYRVTTVRLPDKWLYTLVRVFLEGYNKHTRKEVERLECVVSTTDPEQFLGMLKLLVDAEKSNNCEV